ncbi:DUF3307 domain-containing protein [Bacillus sp. sid0103]|uniref:DUF3307 domain-containing protein n=1 Tax=Bacillus sp. sid0103 TaxID=2856337 RepID=UPI001C442D78|nr:DUF3307 domain-containing protein [Bacillus sp. sid0103]MBV7507725.1 DUF3307 domain-containing protein [Bacillus sp. sid0103]
MLFFSLVLAHLIADFYLQTDDMVIEKRKNLRRHTIHHFFMTVIVLIGFWVHEFHFKNVLTNLFIPLIAIVISHFIVDYFKIKLLDKMKITNEENMKRLGYFVFDQGLHLGVILFVCMFCFQFEIKGLFKDGGLGFIDSVLFIIIIIILATTVSGHMIKILLGSLPNQLLTFEGKYSFKNERNETEIIHKGRKGLTEEYNYTVFSKHDLSRGKLIGYIERLLVLLLTFYSSYPAIGFIVAAKSIARFKQMDDRDWAEYFLLGTLTSMFLGITLGILLKAVLT